MMFASSDNALRSAMSSATSWRTARSSTASGGAPVVAVYRSRLALLQGSGWNEPRVSNPLRCRPAIVPSQSSRCCSRWCAAWSWRVHCSRT